jgi:hypothetical protein
MEKIIWEILVQQQWHKYKNQKIQWWYRQGWLLKPCWQSFVYDWMVERVLF